MHAREETLIACGCQVTSAGARTKPCVNACTRTRDLSSSAKEQNDASEDNTRERGSKKQLPWDQTARPNQGPEAEVRAKESAAHGYIYTHECDVQNWGQQRQDFGLHMRHPVLCTFPSHLSLSARKTRRWA